MEDGIIKKNIIDIVKKKNYNQRERCDNRSFLQITKKYFPEKPSDNIEEKKKKQYGKDFSKRNLPKILTPQKYGRRESKKEGVYQMDFLFHCLFFTH